MTFLNVSLAMGAAACVIPLVIHLLNRQRFDVVRWGAMHLITPIIRTNRKRIRFEQLILLLMRMAILALLALCMAGPVLTGWHALSGNAKTSLALLFDNSYSMDAGSNAATNLDLAKRNAGQLIEHQRRGSDLAVSLMAGGKLHGSTTPTTNLKQSAKEIKEAPSGFGTADIIESFTHATRALGKMQHAKRDLVIVSDFQAKDWSGDAAAALGQAAELIDAMPIKPTITLMQVGSEANDNISIQSIEITPRVVAVDQIVSLRVNLRNHSEIPFPGVRVNIQVDGKDRHSDTIDLGGKADGQLLFQHTFTEPGSHVVGARAEADSLHLDNGFLAVVPVWDRLPVLLVDGDPHEQVMQSETGFLQLALSPFLTAASLPEGSGDETLPRADLLAATTVADTQFTAEQLKDPRVLVLANVGKLSPEQLQAVENFVREGNSLLVFPGNRIDADWYQSKMCRATGLMSMAFGPLQSQSLAGPVTLSGDPIDDEQSGAVIAATRIDHPALDLFNDSRNGKLSDAKLQTWYRLVATGFESSHEVQFDAAGDVIDDQPVDVGHSNVIARLENGDPLLVENSFGKGRVIVCATACDDQWSNLPSRPFYLPLMQRLVTYLAMVVEPRRNLSVGQTIVAQLRSGVGTVTINRPDGKQVDIREEHRGKEGILEYSATDQEGLYTLQAASLPPMHFSVVAPRGESELTLLDQDQMGSLAKTFGATVVRSSDEFIAQDSQRRYGREIWRPMYWLMFCLVVAEILLQQVFSGVPFRQPSQPA